MDLSSILLKNAEGVGFPLAGLVDIDLAYSDQNEVLKQHITFFEQWLESGFHGSMEYLNRGRDRRADPRLLMPEAQSVLCVALPYSTQEAGTSEIEKGVSYARYLKSGDYHFLMKDLLEKVMEQSRFQWQAESNHPTLKWKVAVDTSAVLERTWAHLSGLGWIGKNTLLIHPQYGSYLFLGVVLINLPTGKSPVYFNNYCGNCERCLQACPTQAFVGPGIIDSRKCISYLTLEKREELALAQGEREKIQNWVAGCDVCQDICPFNTKPKKREAAGSNLVKNFQLGADVTQSYTWAELLAESPQEYSLRVKTSAMKRIKPAQFSRNLAVALQNAIETSKDSTFLDTVKAPLVQRLRNESDHVAKQAWENCYQALEQREKELP